MCCLRTGKVSRCPLYHRCRESAPLFSNFPIFLCSSCKASILPTFDPICHASASSQIKRVLLKKGSAKTSRFYCVFGLNFASPYCHSRRTHKTSRNFIHIKQRFLPTFDPICYAPASSYRHSRQTHTSCSNSAARWRKKHTLRDEWIAGGEESLAFISIARKFLRNLGFSHIAERELLLGISRHSFIKKTTMFSC